MDNRKRETITVGDCFQRGFAKIRVVGFKGKTTVLVSVHTYPISSRPLPPRGIRIKTLLRDWTPLSHSNQDVRRIGAGG